MGVGERNLKLTIAYDGTRFVGWQRQNNGPTIQGELEDKISLMTDCKTVLCGAGRTDAGVHALGMVANFKTDSSIPCDGFQKWLNSLLPDDIRVLEIEEVAADFHARISARGKFYQYRMALGGVSVPTERLYRLQLPGNLDLQAVASCLNELPGEHDFSSFEAIGSRDLSYEGGRGAIRRIFSAELKICANDPRYIDIEISGDGFLRYMVRNIVGTLIEIGRGRWAVEQFALLFAARDRAMAGPTAPAHGLFLKEVFY
ncbi:MAG: tRNA pseudouridine(38-40) synthase TruA [Proteobacteria bacterium]|nr:tRNA pseudouridine(38-40) synthase TruA [Pseudomonadota bacterium]MBU1716352.1 tRNA pseudouridine(38-40) synthase TruA [Pseudomonadota bacterium]